MDPMQAAIKSDQLKSELGVYVQPGLGTAVPGLRETLMQFYRDRVAKITWVPLTWISSVSAINDANPTDIVKISAAKYLNGNIIPGLPAWVTASPDRVAVWHELSQTVGKMQGDAAAKLNGYLNGDPAFAKIQADAAFYNSPLLLAASSVQQALINAPSAVSNAAGTFVSDLAGGFLKKAGWIIALVVVGYIAWSNRSVLAGAAGGAVKKAAKNKRFLDWSKPLSDPVTAKKIKEATE